MTQRTDFVPVLSLARHSGLCPIDGCLTQLIDGQNGKLTLLRLSARMGVSLHIVHFVHLH